MIRLILKAICVLAIASSAFAQAPAGSITGVITDQQGAAIPGTDVAVIGADATFHVTTPTDGAFRFLNLEPGRYTVSASLDGFETTRRDIVVALGKNVEAPIVLRVAGLVASVTVTAPMLDAKATGTATTFSAD